MSARRIETVRLAWIEAFLMVAECESQSEAARRLECNQSTISRYMRELQSWLRRPLFDSIEPLRLSADGKRFRDTAKTVVELLEASRAPKRRKVSIKDIDMSQFRKTKTNKDGTA